MNRKEVDSARYEARFAISRFTNGLTMDGRQRHAVIKLLGAQSEYIRELEQQVWNLENKHKCPWLWSKETLDAALDYATKPRTP